MSRTITDQEIAEAVKKWCSSWLNKPQLKPICSGCGSSYEPSYCETIDGKTVCKGCKEAPLED